MKKKICLYKRNDKIFIAPTGKTTKGLTIEIDPVTELISAIDAGTLGKNILDAFSESGKSVPHPEQFKSPVESAAGAKNWNEFVRGTKSVSVRLDENGFRIAPLQPAKRGNFEFDLKQSVILPADASIEMLGEAIQHGFTLANEYKLK